MEFKLTASGTTTSVTALTLFNDRTALFDKSVTAEGYVGDTLALASTSKMTSVNVATTSALPTVVYANGTLGVGATLTASANGTLTVDGVQVALNDRVLIKNQGFANATNGIYKCTTAGATGVKFVLTRVIEADTTSDYTNGIWVLVNKGTLNAGTMWVNSTFSPVMGTDSILWGPSINPNPTDVTLGGLDKFWVLTTDGIQSVEAQALATYISSTNSFSDTLGDVYLGSNRDRYRFLEDFEVMSAAVTANNTRIAGSLFTIMLAGAGTTATQVQSSENMPGVVDLSTGSTSAGYCNLLATPIKNTFNRGQSYKFGARIRTASAYTGTQSYLARIGLGDTFDTGNNPIDGIFFEISSGNIQCVTVSNTVRTAVDSGVVNDQTWTLLYWEFFPTGISSAHVNFYINNTLVQNITANIPLSNTQMFAGIQWQKQRGRLLVQLEPT
jgi:hypothetical protein